MASEPTRDEIAVSVPLVVEVYEAEEGGYWGTCPDLPGCVSEGDTREELLSNLVEAAMAWLGPRPVLSWTPAEAPAVEMKGTA